MTWESVDNPDSGPEVSVVPGWVVLMSSQRDEQSQAPGSRGAVLASARAAKAAELAAAQVSYERTC